LLQNQQQQRQDLRQEQRQNNVPQPERREQRQDLRQNQQQQRQDLQKRQQEERQKLQQQQRDQRLTPPANQNQGQTPNRPGVPNVQQQQRPAVPPSGQQGQQGVPSLAQPNRVEDRARRLEDIRSERREIQQGNQRIIQEGSRAIVQDGNRKFIRHDENERFRRLGRDVTVQQLGSETRTFAVGPGGSRIVNVTGPDGRLLRRSRFVNGREVVIIDNRPRGGRAATAFFVALPAIALATLAIPRERYIVEAESAPPEYIYGALMAPPVEPLERAYTLDEIRYSPELRDRMPRIDLDTVTFDTGSWEIAPDQYGRLAPIAEGIKRAIAQNPNEVFLIEGHTDAVGNDDDNLSLSDRRAEAVSVVLSDQFQIPPENLTTQGYGEQQLKVPSQGPERANRRVTVRRITPLLQQNAELGGNTPIPPDQIPEEQRQFAPPAQDQRIAPPRRQTAPAQNQFAPR
jgi:outer membrane protein OmpA-like peptidoglycan-associated protein